MQQEKKSGKDLEFDLNVLRIIYNSKKNDFDLSKTVDKIHETTEKDKSFIEKYLLSERLFTSEKKHNKEITLNEISLRGKELSARIKSIQLTEDNSDEHPFQGFNIKKFYAEIVKDPIYKAIEERIIESDDGIPILIKNEPKFFPYNIPTGEGKTYASAKLMILLVVMKCVEESENKRDLTFSIPESIIYYLTGVKEGVENGYQEFLKQLKNSNLTKEQKKYVKSKVYLFKANSESILEKGNGIDFVKIFKIFGKIEKETQDLCDSLKLVMSESIIALNYNEKLPTSIEKELEETRRKFVSHFINLLRKESSEGITEEFKEKFLNVKNDVLSLIPTLSVETGDCFAAFLTTSKFLYPFNTTSYYVPSESEKNIFIIDEIDGQSEIFLNHLIDSSNRDNLFNNVRRIYYNLKGSGVTKESEYKGILINEVSTMIEFLDELSEEFNLKHSYEFGKDIKSQKDFKSPTIFDDRIRASEYSDEKSELYIEIDRKTGQNFITKNKLSNDIENKKVTHLSNSLDSFYNVNFPYSIKTAAENLLKNETLYKGDPKSVRLDKAIRRCLQELNLDDYHSHVMRNSVSNNNQKQESLKQLVPSYHLNGFRITNLNEDKNGTGYVEMTYQSINTTPGGMLASMVLKKNTVIGISATALHNSTISNFPSEFLIEVLGNKYDKLKKEEIIEINDFISSRKNYKRALEEKTINYDINKITPIEKDIFKSKYESIPNLDLNNLPLSDYQFVQMSKTIKSIENFISSDSRCHYIFTTRFNRQENEKNFLNTIIKYLSKDKGVRTAVRYVNTEIAKGDELTNSISSHLAQPHTKFIVFTSYKSIGAGYNGQYLCMDNKYIDISFGKNEKSGNIYVDIDSFYFDMPTNILAFTQGNDVQKTRMIMYHNALSLNETDEFSDQKLKQVKKTIGTASNDNPAFNKVVGDYNKTKDRNENVIKIMNQVVGRGSRTSIKRETIRFDIDVNIWDILNSHHIPIDYFEMFSFDFKTIVNTINSDIVLPTNELSKDIEKLKNKATRCSSIAKEKIQKSLNGLRSQNKKSINNWINLRHQLLKNPTASDEESGKSQNRGLYLETPTSGTSYYYNYSGTDIQKAKSNSFGFFECNDKSKLFCFERTGLEKLLKHNFVLEHFERNEFAIKFEEHRNMMTPVVFESIYLPAIAEEVVKSLFLSRGYSSNDLEEGYFEFFDYIVSDGLNDALIDVKNYSLLSNYNTEYTEEVINKAYSKLRTIGNYDSGFLIRLWGEESNQKIIKHESEDGLKIYAVNGLFDHVTGDILHENILNTIRLIKNLDI